MRQNEKGRALVTQGISNETFVARLVSFSCQERVLKGINKEYRRYFKIITVLGCNVTRKLEYPAHYKSVFCVALILEHASSFSLKGKHLFLVYVKRILHSFITRHFGPRLSKNGDIKASRIKKRGVRLYTNIIITWATLSLRGRILS